MTERRSLVAALVLLAGWIFANGAIGQTADEKSTESTTAPAGPPEAMLRRIRVAREEEDWRWLLGEHQSSDLFDPIKAIPLGSSEWTLGFGGEARARFESTNAPNWGLSGDDSIDFWLLRSRLYADLRSSRGIRFFTELQAADRSGPDDAPRPSIDRTSVDLQQAFVDLPVIGGSSLRLGRQELSFGVGRMISARAGPINVRQPQDGLRWSYQGAAQTVDLFAVRIVEIGDDAFDDRSRSGERLVGAYWTIGQPYVSQRGLELYAFSRARNRAVYFQGAGTEDRHSVGVRTWTPIGEWASDIEAVYQFGKFGEDDIAAWALSARIVRNFDRPLQPEIEFAAGINSGDRRAGDGTNNTFVAPLPRGAYFGQFAPFGPSNVQGIRVAGSIRPLNNVTVAARLYAFWRQSADDGLYGVSGFPLVRPLDRSRELGLQPEMSISAELGRHLFLDLDLALFDRSGAIRSIPGSQDIESASLTIRAVF